MKKSALLIILDWQFIQVSLSLSIFVQFVCLCVWKFLLALFHLFHHSFNLNYSQSSESSRCLGVCVCVCVMNTKFISFSKSQNKKKKTKLVKLNHFFLFSFFCCFFIKFHHLLGEKNLILFAFGFALTKQNRSKERNIFHLVFSIHKDRDKDSLSFWFSLDDIKPNIVA